MVVQEFERLTIPATFTTRSAARSFFQGEVDLTPQEYGQMHRILCAVENKELDDLVKEGRISVGLIKPNAQESRNLSPVDDIAAATILSEINQTRLLFSIPTQFSQDQAESFYAPLKVKYEKIYRPNNGISIWSSIIGQITSGPLTFLLLYSKNEDAVSWWRETIGATNPTTANPASIRGKYALEEKLPNNLVHGSDSAESALRELQVMRNVLYSITEWY